MITGGADAAVLATDAVEGLGVTWLSTTQVRLETGQCRDDAGGTIVVGSAITLDITTSGAGGLDTGSEANSQLYHVWVCAGSSGVSAVLSASESSPTLPSGYDAQKRRLWACVMNNSSGDISGVHVVGVGRQRVVFIDYDPTDQLVLSGGTATTPTAVDLSSVVPLSAVRVFVRKLETNVAGGNSFGAGPTGQQPYLTRSGITTGLSAIRMHSVPLAGDAQMLYWNTGGNPGASMSIAVEYFEQVV